ncbi:hypothetical protein [Gimesia panareensis]|uniref:Uncharacterized protein n=1 Tax=Gimesia panareensis TaxID=2527978 RepID=A0A517Q9R4_9PLAN|nr:hypothetical protein [Gimesia panareensis]QDT28367.1 hypothetical protein Enr10x_37090 [Gimesia panareensis]QDU51235.1 hypothetical protein Pan110_35990 [Gimesia panareensis]
MISIKTVRQGERVAVWDYKGRVDYVDGPRRLILFRKSIEPLRQYCAGADQYLSIEFADGHCEHQRGPTSVWYDPVQHLSIDIKNSLELDSHEAIVVYRRVGNEVHRRVERGPMLFVPEENEWLHDFRWHGADPKDPAHKIPRALRFHKLRVIPDQTYYLVDDVRTADDALLTVKLMIFFELADIEKMLDQTHDPIADFINAVTADVVDFAGTRSFEVFKQDTEQLNELESYQNLMARAARIGYQVNKVVYRGYTAGETLQAMHDNAIEARTRLKLDAETEIQAQELADVQLAREAIRAEKRQEMESKQTEHDIHLQRLQHDEQIHQDEELNLADEETRRRVNQIELEHQRSKNEEQGRYLAAMREMQIDLTRYLVAQYQNPDRLIRISGDNDASLHLHEEG